MPTGEGSSSLVVQLETSEDDQMRTRAAIIVLILVFFGQLALGSVQLSLTSDEPPHIAHGYLLLTTGDTWALDEHRHPPLLNMLSALPLLLQPERPDVTSIPGWHADFAVFVRNVWPLLGPVERQAMAARVPTMLLAVLLLALVARWARGVAGAAGALLAVAVMAFDPLMVAHSQLATTDVGVALFTVAAIYIASRVGTWGLSPLRAGLLSGLATGAALASKGSALIAVPVVFSVLAWRVLGPDWAAGGATRRRALARWLVAGIMVTVTTLMVLWATYGFRLEPSAMAGIDLPLVAHTQMVRLILGEKARTAFLAGEVRQGGWFWYFPYAFLVKAPLPLIACCSGRCSVWAAGWAGHYDDLSSGLTRPCTLMAVTSGMNIGLRHLLPGSPLRVHRDRHVGSACAGRTLSTHPTPSTGAPGGLASRRGAQRIPVRHRLLPTRPSEGLRVATAPWWTRMSDWGQSFIALK